MLRSHPALRVTDHCLIRLVSFIYVVFYAIVLLFIIDVLMHYALWQVRSSDTLSKADDGLSRGGGLGGGSVAGSLETFDGGDGGSVYSKHSQLSKAANARLNRATGGAPSIPSKGVTSQLRALRVPGASRELSGSPAGLMSASGGNSEAYVLKGGFKMPRSSGSLGGGGSVASSLG